MPRAAWVIIAVVGFLGLAAHDYIAGDYKIATISLLLAVVNGLVLA